MQYIWAVNPEPLLPLLRQTIEVLGLVSLLDWLRVNPLYAVAGIAVVAIGFAATRSKG